MKNIIVKDIFHAVAFNNKKKIEKMMPKHANDKDKRGKSVLHYASWDGNNEIVKILIASGANINAQDEKGQTPLHKAIINNNYDVINILLKAGADINIRDNNGKKCNLKNYNKHIALNIISK